MLIQCHIDYSMILLIILQITKSVVRDLSKSELEELGVKLLGDQKRLRSACNPPPTGTLAFLTHMTLHDIVRIIGRLIYSSRWHTDCIL